VDSSAGADSAEAASTGVASTGAASTGVTSTGADSIVAACAVAPSTGTSDPSLFLLEKALKIGYYTKTFFKTKVFSVF
jgi:hypothetical protein